MFQENLFQVSRKVFRGDRRQLILCATIFMFHQVKPSQDYHDLGQLKFQCLGPKGRTTVGHVHPWWLDARGPETTSTAASIDPVSGSSFWRPQIGSGLLLGSEIKEVGESLNIAQ